MARLTGKNVLITGGTTGIGFAAAKLMLQEGARVAITGQDPQRVADAGKALGPQAVAIVANVASASDMTALATRLKSEFGALDVVFANAGIAQPKTLGDIDERHIDEQVDVNFKGVIYTVQKMLPLLLDRTRQRDPHVDDDDRTGFGWLERLHRDQGCRPFFGAQPVR